jgi:hypothetical protein
MANPSFEPAFVIASVHPAGGVTLLGELSKKSSPGTHPNQNVPMVVEPVSSTVTVYWVSPERSGVAAIVADALSDIVELLVPTPQIRSTVDKRLTSAPYSTDSKHFDLQRFVAPKNRFVPLPSARLL